MQSFFRPLSGSSARLALGLTLLGIAGAACADPELPEAPQSAQAVRCAAFYIDVPSAGNPVANLMLGSVVSKAAWMDQLKALMARGAEPPMTRLVVVQSALGSFKQQRLSYLTLTVAGQSPKMQGLQRSAEQLGITFRAATPERSAASPEARADAYLRGVCD